MKEFVKEYPKKMLSTFLRQVSIWTVTSGMAAGLALVVPFGTLLYIEQNKGSRLPIFDVTDPARIKGPGPVEADAPEPFDLASSLGSRAEPIWFRQSQGNAVLDLHKAKVLALKIFGIEVELKISLPGMVPEAAPAPVDKAHIDCLYSNSTRNDIDVRLTLA